MVVIYHQNLFSDFQRTMVVILKNLLDNWQSFGDIFDRGTILAVKTQII
jgi:hypothetical protein